MTLSIVQRIKAGFALLLLLLLILGGISYLQTTGIHNQLKQVTEKATPLAMTTTRLREALLLANRYTLAHLSNRQATALPALLLGVVSVAAPLLLMQPGFGMGLAASRMANPWQVRLRALVTHLVFGLGVYMVSWVVAQLLALPLCP